jgi:hypothetical protein
VREVCAGSKDILLNKVTTGIKVKIIGCAFCIKRSEYKQGREITKRKYKF